MRSPTRHRRSIALLPLIVLALAVPAAGASASTISGQTYQDLNRDQVHQASEPVLTNQQIYLFDSTGRCVDVQYTGSDGRYSFDWPDGDYRVAYASPSYSSLRNDWVPTTTGSARPEINVHLAGSATADFGWRQIVRSTDVNAPISSYTGSNGLTVHSYDDVVTARALYDDLMSGQLVGAEASYVTVRFDYGGQSATQASAGTLNGKWANYSAASYVTYASWLDGGDQTLFHEYGHAWSLYYAYIVQQDETLAAYIRARGLSGDSRVGSSYDWSPREMIAEDYRQLFGTPNAQAMPQANREIPPAASVPGLRDFLANTFRTPPAGGGGGGSTPPPPPPPAPALAISGLAMNPDPVKTTGTASFTLSAPATVTATVRSGNTVVRTLLSGVSKPSGSNSITWDRKDDAGRRVKSGNYSVVVTASSGGSSTTANDTFAVS